ncbi:MAG: DUF1294 domain-containing protein [Lachnospiraceae bacterium]|nr:DUF1294 domain-containing protein [Lachnospiraceae bacterium]MBQ6856056.1 DUF1294 domain-containing protein [Lachnospiraceae bacterium]
MIIKVVAAVLAVINLAAFVMWGVDKARAKKGAWRISESALLLIALLGGGLGALLGMLVFRHKTQKWQFKIGVPICLMYQVGLILMVWFLTKYWGLGL